MDGNSTFPSNGSYAVWVDFSAFDYPVADDQSVTVQEDAVNFPITLTGSSPNSSELTFLPHRSRQRYIEWYCTKLILYS